MSFSVNACRFHNRSCNRRYTESIASPSSAPARPALFVALASLALAALWLTADVRFHHAGHLSGLFYTGATVRLPPGPVADHTFRVRDDRGYDGQFYHLLAHDPLNLHGTLQYIDSPRYRWRRIALPALAFLLAAGNGSLIDPVYVALELLFVFLGAWWLARYAQAVSISPAVGLAFLVIPAAASSLDRMLVDLPVAAFTIALLLYGLADSAPKPLYAALLMAPLTRETGFLLILAWCVYCWTRQRRREAILGAACAIPAALWFLYTALHSPPDATAEFAAYPLGGLVTWTRHAFRDPIGVYGRGASLVLEFAALAGIWLAFALAARIVLRRSFQIPELIALVFALFACLIGVQDIWATAYGIGRTLSPLLVALAAIALRDRQPLFASPLLLVAPRILLQLAAEIRVGLRG